MTAKVGPKGQVVVPKDIRDRLGLLPGTAVAFRLRPEDGVVEIRPTWQDPIRDGPAHIQALTREPAGLPASEVLRSMRREDEELWQEQLARLGARRWSSTRTP